MPHRLVLLTCAMLGTGCYSGFEYAAKPAKAPQLADGTFVVSVKKVESPYGCGFGVDIAVQNTSDHLAWFDPDELMVVVPKTGKTYTHVNKLMAMAETLKFTPGVWDQVNVAFKNPIPAGGTYAATVWYETAFGDSNVTKIDITYAKQTVHLPK